MGKVSHYESCPECGSKNNLAVYTDVNGEVENKYCFTPGCTYRYHKTLVVKTWPKGKHQAIKHRGISQATCVKYDVRSHGPYVWFPYYRLEGQKVGAVKRRNFLFNKRAMGHMSTEGDIKGLFFGTQATHTKNMIAIAFGEFDAMSVYQVTGVACLAVSDSGFVTALRNHYHWLVKFQKIIIVPDQDESCRRSLEEAEDVLPKAQTYIATFAYKDANEYLQRRQGDLLKRAFYSAQPYAGNLFVDTLADLVTAEQQQLGLLSGTALDRFLLGFRAGELTTIMGSPTVGKTTYTRYLAASMIRSHIKMAIVSAEEGAKKYVPKLVRSIVEKSELDQSEKQALVPYLDEHVKLYKGGTFDVDNVAAFIRASVMTFGCRIILIDNLSAIARPEKQFEDIGNYINLFRRLVDELSIHIICVSHTSRVQVTEDLKDTQLMQLGYGSSSIEKYSWNVVVILRQPTESRATIKVVKNREIGPKGCGTFYGEFNAETFGFREYVGTKQLENSTSRQSTEGR